MKKSRKFIHPDLAYLMDTSEAMISVFSKTFAGEKKLVCRIPIPDITGNVRWTTQRLPADKYVPGENGEKGEWVVREGWVRAEGDPELGEHWVLPEYEKDGIKYAEKTYIIEDREQFNRRQAKETDKNISKIMAAAKAVQDMYRDCGDIPDEDYVTVEVSISVDGAFYC